MTASNQVYRISRRGVNFIKQWEGFVPFIYDDLVRVNGRYAEWKGGRIIGTLTIGYGHTKSASGQYPMTVGTRITETRAVQLLDEDLDPVESYVNRVVKVPITQAQFDALVSITYNFGEGNLRKSILLARLNAGDYRGARSAFGLYVNSKGKRLQGLANRRLAEQKLWDLKDQSVASLKKEDALPQEYSSRDVVPVTPKEIDQPVTPTAANTAEGSSGLATSGLGTTGMGSQVSDALDKASGYAEQAGSVMQTADAFGVAPLGLAAIIGPKAAAFFSFLLGSPLFWLFLGITVLGLVVFFVKRWKARQEVLVGEYKMAGTPLPQLVAGDSGYAGVDTTGDPDTEYYRIDMADVTSEDEIDAPINLEETPTGRRKAPVPKRATKKRKARK